MQLNEAIRTRRSTRIFSDKKLEEGTLEKIISAGQYAPSHCNTQGWKFIFIDDAKIKNEIFENGGSFVIKNAPYGILVLYNTALSDNLEYKDWIQSGSAAIQNMLLTIQDLGLGGSWIAHLPQKKTLKKILKIKKPYSPIAYIIFGYPKKNPDQIKRKDKISDIYSINKFIWPKEKTSLKTQTKRLLRKIYFRLPKFAKKTIHPIVDKFVKKFSN